MADDLLNPQAQPDQPPPRGPPPPLNEITPPKQRDASGNPRSNPYLRLIHEVYLDEFRKKPTSNLGNTWQNRDTSEPVDYLNDMWSAVRPNPSPVVTPILQRLASNDLVYTLVNEPEYKEPAETKEEVQEKEELKKKIETKGIMGSLDPQFKPGLKTFGIELELLIGCYYPGNPPLIAESGVAPNLVKIPLKYEVESSQRRFVTQHITNTLIKHGFRVHIGEDRHDGRIRKNPDPDDSRLKRNDFLPRGEMRADLNHPTDLSAEEASFYWSIVQDGSLHGDQAGGDGLVWLAIEITSPALWEGDASTRQVERLMMVLHKFYEVRVNETCGLHVHVGCGHERYTLDHFRKSAALLIALEPLLERLHIRGRGRQFYSRRAREEHANPAAAGKSPDEVWASFYEWQPTRALNMLAGSRQRRFVDEGMTIDPRDLWIPRATETMQDVWMGGGVQRVDRRLDCTEEFERVFGGMANDLMGIHGTAFSRPDLDTPIGYPNVNVVMEQKLPMGTVKHDWLEPVGPSSGRMPNDLWGVAHPANRYRGYFCLDDDTNLYKKTVESTHKENVKAHKRMAEVAEAKANKTPYEGGKKITDPQVYTAKISELVSTHGIQQPIDWQHHREIRRANGLLRPLAPSGPPREKYYEPEESSHPDMKKVHPKFSHADLSSTSNISMWSMVTKILSCDVNSAQLAYLLTTWSAKYTMFNFMRMGGNPLPGADTIEIRMGSPSVDPAWIATWARVCVAIISFAGRANYREYMHMLRLVSNAQIPVDPLSRLTTRREYDIVSFLEDIGESDLSRRVNARLQKPRDEYVEFHTFFNRGHYEDQPIWERWRTRAVQEMENRGDDEEDQRAWEDETGGEGEDWARLRQQQNEEARRFDAIYGKDTRPPGRRWRWKKDWWSINKQVRDRAELIMDTTKLPE